MRLKFLAPALIAGMMVLTTSCSKDDNPTPIPSTAKEVKELNVS